MMPSSHLDKYLLRYSEYENYPLYGGETADLDQVVVIPA